MQTYSTKFERVLAEQIENELLRTTETLTAGTATDFAAVQKLVGQVQGLKMVRDELMPEAEKLCRKE